VAPTAAASRYHRRVTRGRLVLGAIVVALAAAVPLAVAMQSKTPVKVTEKEFKVTPLPKTGKPGVVAFTVRNAGKLAHDFVVLKTNRAPGKLPVKNNKAVLLGTVKGTIAKFGPGKTKSLILKLPAGKYVLLCNVKGHYQFGMYAGFKVG
jgi:uncharacterized cupredoxin-like copper-binding protein